MLLKDAASEFETSLLSNYPKTPALTVLCAGASPSMRERRINRKLLWTIKGKVASAGGFHPVWVNCFQCFTPARAYSTAYLGASGIRA